MDPGTHGIVLRISDQQPEILQYLRGRDFSVGTRFQLEQRNPAAGSLSVSRSSTTGEHGDQVEIAAGAADAVWVSLDPHPASC
jgi:DtxR family Mn-dependent transcriptional regulator